MTSALLILTLLSADEAAASQAAVTSKVEPDEWPLEGRLIHYGVGARVHAGVLESVNAPRLLLQSEFMFFISIRAFSHHEFRAAIGVAGGWPDTVAGETNLSFRWHLSPRFAIGVGTFTYWGFWSMRVGAEVPIAIRLGSNRRHEITFTVRGTGGLYNNTITFVWYDFRALRPAWSLDAAIGYAAIF